VSSHPSDQVLVRAARDGSVDAFAELVRRHEAPVYRTALRMLGSRVDAEDVAQEAFIQAWRSLARFRGDSTFSTWIYRIATNRSLNAIAARRPTVDIDAVELASPLSAAERTEQRDRLRRTVAAILRLEPEQRALIVLRELEGLSYAEIAAILEIEETKVKGRLHRARAALANTVEEEP
jgi:RNA polymerase sigma-70 factor, ECF subfamily